MKRNTTANLANRKFADRHNGIDIAGTVILSLFFIGIVICLLNSNGNWIASFSIR